METFPTKVMTVRNPLPDRSITVFLDVTDRGADQASRRRRLANGLASNPSILYIGGDCYLHAFHNAIKDGLVLIDNMIPAVFNESTLKGFRKYYASLAKLCNVWREKAKDIMYYWDLYHSNRDDLSPKELEEMLALGRRYPWSIVSGRWGSVEAGEDFMLERKPENVIPVLLRALSSSMKAKRILMLRNLSVLFSFISFEWLMTSNKPS